MCCSNHKISANRDKCAVKNNKKNKHLSYQNRFHLWSTRCRSEDQCWATPTDSAHGVSGDHELVIGKL